MSSLLNRLILEDGEPRLQERPRLTVNELISRLEDGRTPQALGLGAADFLAVVAFSALGGPDGLGPPLVQQSPPRPRLRPRLHEPELAELIPEAGRPARLSLSAGLLQIHDFWDPSHEAAQTAEDEGERHSSAYWHGIGHRREPDPGNASYWFRRVGRHPALGRMAQEAEPLLDAANDPRWKTRLLDPGWNPFAMIDLCTQARPGTSHEVLARRLQRLEMLILLEATAAAILETH
jgi:hypothetical protein